MDHCRANANQDCRRVEAGDSGLCKIKRGRRDASRSVGLWHAGEARLGTFSDSDAAALQLRQSIPVAQYCVNTWHLVRDRLRESGP